MSNTIKFLIIMIACIGIGSCGATNYTYYSLNRPGNKLMGVAESDDLPLDKTCDPDPGCFTAVVPKGAVCSKCIAMLTEDYFKAKKELLELRQRVKDLEKGPSPNANIAPMGVQK